VFDRLVFYLSWVGLAFSALVILVEAGSPPGGCRMPLTPALLYPLVICGLLCLGLASDRSERIPVALVLVLTVATIVSVALLRQPPVDRHAYPDAIGDVRTVLSGQAAYQGVNGFYDTLECLAKPSSCIPGYPSAMPSFLDVHLAQREPYGQYRRWLVPGPPVTDRPSSASRTSTRTFAYVAVPLDSRLNSLCADDTGDIFAAPAGITPNIRDGHCDDPRFRAFK